MKKTWLFALPIPILFALGVAAFFVLIPSDLRTIGNFVSFMSGLSTTIMVLVYVFTTSRQLETMRCQLGEMQYSRNVQVQPLPFLEKPRTRFEFPRYFASPEDDFKKMFVMCEMEFSFLLSNLGNGPALSVDVFPNLCSVSYEGEVKQTIAETSVKRVECVSLREGDSQEIDLYFEDYEHKIVNALVEQGRVCLLCTLLYKNAVGMTFREHFVFFVMVGKHDVMEKLTSCLKIIKTAELDYAKEAKEYERLMNLGRHEEAQKILEGVNKKLEKNFEGKKQIDLSIQLATGGFDVSPLSQSEYEKILLKEEEKESKIRSEINRCWVRKEKKFLD